MRHYWLNSSYMSNLSKDTISIISGLLYTLVLVAVFYIADLNCKDRENFWDVSPYAQCKGGEYMWQGDSPEAKMCRQFAKTNEGRCGIASYNCPKGFNGQPNFPFYYTPLSDDKWQNEQCKDIPTCQAKNCGLTSDVKLVN